MTYGTPKLWWIHWNREFESHSLQTFLLFKVNNYLDFEYGVTCDVTLVIYEPTQFLHSGKSSENGIEFVAPSLNDRPEFFI